MVQGKVRFGATPKPARETRALPKRNPPPAAFANVLQFSLRMESPARAWVASPFQGQGKGEGCKRERRLPIAIPSPHAFAVLRRGGQDSPLIQGRGGRTLPFGFHR
jgi:hypothetical protein